MIVSICLTRLPPFVSKCQHLFDSPPLCKWLSAFFKQPFPSSVPDIICERSPINFSKTVLLATYDWWEPLFVSREGGLREGAREGEVIPMGMTHPGRGWGGDRGWRKREGRSNLDEGRRKEGVKMTEGRRDQQRGRDYVIEPLFIYKADL